MTTDHDLKKLMENGIRKELKYLNMPMIEALMMSLDFIDDILSFHRDKFSVVDQLTLFRKVQMISSLVLCFNNISRNEEVSFENDIDNQVNLIRDTVKQFYNERDGEKE